MGFRSLLISLFQNTLIFIKCVGSTLRHSISPECQQAALRTTAETAAGTAVIYRPMFPYSTTRELLLTRSMLDETNATASIQNISRTFEMTQAAPETDALFFESAAKGSAFRKLRLPTFTASLRLFFQPAYQRYCASSFDRAVDLPTIEMTQIAEGVGMSRITEIDGTTLIEVIDDERFYDAFNFNPTNGGLSLQPARTSFTFLLPAATPTVHQGNLLLCTRSAHRGRRLPIRTAVLHGER